MGGQFCREPVVFVYKARGSERTLRCFVATAISEQSDTLMKTLQYDLSIFLNCSLGILYFWEVL